MRTRVIRARATADRADYGDILKPASELAENPARAERGKGRIFRSEARSFLGQKRAYRMKSRALCRAHEPFESVFINTKSRLHNFPRFIILPRPISYPFIEPIGNTRLGKASIRIFNRDSSN
jgi:hypothetical protein